LTRPNPRAEAPISTPSGAPAAYIVSAFPKLSETFILYEVLFLVRAGFDVCIYTLRRIREPARHAAAHQLESRVVRRPFVSTAILRDNLAMAITRPGRYWGTLASLARGMLPSPHFLLKSLVLWPKAVHYARMMERAGVRHVHVHWATHPATAAFITKRITGIGYSVTAHAHDIYVDQTMLPEKLRAADLIVAISQFNKKLVLELVPDLDPGKIHVIRTGADTTRFRPRKGERRPGPIRLLSVGRLAPMKGFSYLIKACAALYKRGLGFELTIVGGGKLQTELLRLIDQTGTSDVIRMPGPLSQEDLMPLFADADIFVMPSVVLPSGLKEGIPVALMEAMASGLAVVATRISGIPELVEDEVGGLLVPERQAQALADAIQRLADDESLRERLGRAARTRVESEFDLEDNARKLSRLLAELLAGGAKH